MPTIGTLATGTRCEHYAARDACPFCGIEERATGHVATRAARRLAASLRRAIRDAERERDTARGYSLLSGTVSANGVTSPVLAALTDTAETVGAMFYSDVTGETVERVAHYIGRPETDADRRAALLVDNGYARRLARRVARSIATGTGTGRGSMPTFKTDAETELNAIYKRALRGMTAAFTLSDGHGHRRAMTEAERELMMVTLRPARTERSPMYAQWFSGLGATLPDVRDGHGTGHVAPYLPERDAAPLRRGTVWQRLRAVGADVDTVRALRAIFDIVNMPDGNGRYRSSAPWQTVRDALGIGVTSGTVQRRAVRYARAVRERERLELIGQPFAVPDAERGTVGTRLTPIGTGRYPKRGTVTGMPIVSPIGARWANVAPHLKECRNGARCAPSCTALQLVPVRAPVRPLPDGTVTVPQCARHESDTCPTTCPTRVARATRVARWDGITSDTDAVTVRALVASNAKERADTGT
jgi:hypothetical protein